jgi:hypothetical protein
VEKCKGMTAEKFRQNQANAKPLSANPLDNMDCKFSKSLKFVMK